MCDPALLDLTARRSPKRSACPRVAFCGLLLIASIASGLPAAEHWAFVPIRQPPLPSVERQDWPVNPIDRFVLAKLEKRGQSPAPEADRTELIRRLTLDLTGLPPTLAEIDAFLADSSPDAYAKVVDRLLHSPRYGEHRARFWLDGARYGDTHGLHFDNERAIWPYRDWVVEAMNRNLPFDQFTVEQLAGDLLPDATIAQRVATGFHRCNVTTGEEGAINDEFRVRYAIDRVETTGTVWMGLTVGCAACHDHPYDPISQHEFYQLVAIFNNVAEQANNGNALLPPPSIKAPSAGQSLQHERIQQQLRQRRSATPDKAEAAASATSDATSIAPLQKQLRQLESAFSGTMTMRELRDPRPTRFLIRGRYDRPGEQVSPGVPDFLPPLPDGTPPNRLAFAQWLVDRRHPLTARVAVNQLWQQYFGVGIVATSEDFGSEGEPPSHRELLDWLAVEFMDSGWDMKALQRLIITSATYRQTAQVSSDQYRDDPQNRLLARGPRYRMDAEMVRDQALAISGLLVEQLGGRGVKPYQPDGVWEAVAHPVSNTARYEQDHGESLYRRSLYTFWKRTAPPPAMQILDAPSRECCVVRRSRTNTPAAALLLMNDIQFVEAARKLAEQLCSSAVPDDSERLSFAFRRVTGRPPNSIELAELGAALQRFRQHYDQDLPAAVQLSTVGESPNTTDAKATELAAWTMVANLLLNLDEAVTK